MSAPNLKFMDDYPKILPSLGAGIIGFLSLSFINVFFITMFPLDILILIDIGFSILFLIYSYQKTKIKVQSIDWEVIVTKVTHLEIKKPYNKSRYMENYITLEYLVSGNSYELEISHYRFATRKQGLALMKEASDKQFRLAIDPNNPNIVKRQRGILESDIWKFYVQLSSMLGVILSTTMLAFVQIIETTGTPSASLGINPDPDPLFLLSFPLVIVAIFMFKNIIKLIKHHGMGEDLHEPI